MKKIYVLMLAVLCTQVLFAQTPAVSTGFDNYNGTLPTVPAGWYLSWNASNSFYTSAGNFGAAAPSYKFGNDSDFVVAPMVPQGADSVSFFLKGNGAPFSALNELRILQSPDSINWIQVTAFNGLPTTGAVFSASLNGQPYVKFVYHKEPAGGNIAFDDVAIFSNGPTGLNEIPGGGISVYPAPSNGILTVSGLGNADCTLEVYDLLGNLVQGIAMQLESNGTWTLNMTHCRKGIYFLRIRNGTKVISRKITISG